MEIYDDLDNYNEQRNIEKLQSENQYLKSKLQDYQSSMEKLKMDFDKLETEHKNLLANFSSLLKTARAEIERKTQTIMQINSEKDQLVLRMASNSNFNSFRPKHFGGANKRGSSDLNESTKETKKVSRPNEISNQKFTEKLGTPEPSTVCKKTETNSSTNVRDKENKDRQFPMSIAERRKSIPGFRCDDNPKFSTDEEFDTDEQMDKHKSNRETAKSSTPSSYEERPNDRYRERMSRPIRETGVHDRYRDRYENSRHRERFERERRHDSFRSKYRREEEYEDRYRPSSNRYKLESPPNDRFRDRERRPERVRDDYDRRKSQERHKHKLNDDRENNAKRRKVEIVTENFSRWGQSHDSSSMPFYPLEYLPTSCQSPDENLVDKPVIENPVKEIKQTATTKLDDPRFQSNKYVTVTDSKSNKKVLASVASQNVDLQVLRWNEKEQVNFPSLEACTKTIYDDNLNVEDTDNKDPHTDIDDELLFGINNENSSIIPNSEQCKDKVNKCISQEDKHKSEPKPKYRIPKKNKEENNDFDNRPLKLLFKQYIEEQKSSDEKEESIDNTKKDKLSQDSDPNSRSALIREMVEGDLALSDDNSDNSHIKLTPDIGDNIKKKAKPLVTKNNKSKRAKDKADSSKNVDISIPKPETHKKDEYDTKIGFSDQKDKGLDVIKDIKAKFRDLFEDSSLITPEDLNIPSEPIVVDNCPLALSENANFVGEDEHWNLGTINSEKNIKTSSRNAVKETDKLLDKQSITRNISLEVTVDVVDDKNVGNVDTKGKETMDNVTSTVNDPKKEMSNSIILIPETNGLKESGVVKTVIISSGVQQKDAESKVMSAVPSHLIAETPKKALATSTPVREVTKEEAEKPMTNCVIALLRGTGDNISSEVTPQQSMTDSLSESAPDTPDVKIILKRKKRVKK